MNIQSFLYSPPPSGMAQNVFSQGLKGKQPPPLPPPRERPTAARGPSVASAASPAVLVGQAFVHLKSDLMRGIGRSLSLPLSPECFRVDSLQVVRHIGARSPAELLQ